MAMFPKKEMLVSMPDAVIVHGEFQASATPTTNQKGVGFTVSVVSAGKYQVALDQRIGGFVSLLCKIRGSTAGTAMVETRIGDVSIDSGGNATFDVVIMGAADTSSAHIVHTHWTIPLYFIAVVAPDYAGTGVNG